MKDTMLMFIGGIIIALAVEHCNLHQRVALKVISVIGCSQRKSVILIPYRVFSAIKFIVFIHGFLSCRLNFGLLAVTMFVSMWISNTAAIAMMCPIMQAVLKELEAVSIFCLYFILFYFMRATNCYCFDNAARTM